MSQEFQHYQTSFSISSTPGSETELFSKLQHIIFTWIVQKEKQRSDEYGRKDFAMFLPLREFSTKGTAKSKASQFFSEICYSDAGNAWVVEYTHIDGKIKGLSWITNIGLRQFAGQGRVVVSVLLNYRVSTELALARDIALPAPSVPGFVRRVFKAFSRSTISFGGFDIHSTKPYTSLESLEEVKKIASYIEDPSRLLSVVVIVGKSADAEEEAKTLGWALQGKGLVFIVPYDHRLLHEIKRYRIEFRQCRVLLPFGRFGTRLGTHVSYSLDNPEKALAARERAVRSQLGYYTIVEPGAVSSLSDIRDLIRKETFQKLQKDLEGKTKDLQTNEKWKEFADNVMQQYEAESKKCEDLLRQIEDQHLRNLELEDEKAELEKAKNEEIFNLRVSYEAKGRKVREASFKTPSELPETIEVVRDWALSGAFQHLAFSASAWKPVLQYENFSDLGNLWKILWHLDNTLFKMKFIDNVSNLEKAFEDKSGIRYSRSEGKNTANDARLAALRRFQFEGKEYEMWTHVGLGTREPHMIRVYFAFDDDSRRIVIGYVGPHMDNATTRTIH